MAKILVGTSGWVYPSWRSRFYPEKLKQREILTFMSRQFPSLEVNSTFYSLQRPETFQRWYEETPPRFVFALKGSRFISHNKKLRDARGPLANYFASGILRLGEKLGPIVWQLPATAKFDADRLIEFFELLPKDTTSAAALAREHDHRVEGRSWTECAVQRRIRYGLEARHESFFVPELVQLLRKYRVALVVSDAATWPMVEEVTARFVYVRLHGTTRTYASQYNVEQIAQWANKIRSWHAGGQPKGARRASKLALPPGKTRDVYVYFDNDYEANAPWDAQRLMEKLGAM
ncbi:MAG TPA: DUF72 domain-containing protein [Terriglobales bacterium]|nr:DUF72 domain-containing protein [Terriglobales bacterium]